MLRHFGLATALLAFVADPASAQSVSFDFGWKPGMTATVTTTQIQSQSQMGMTSETQYSSEYRLAVEDHPRGVLVRSTNGKMTGFSSPQAAQAPFVEDLMRAMVEADYQMVVDENGILVDYQGSEAMDARVKEILDEALAPMRGMPGAEGMATMFEGLASGDLLKTMVESQWASTIEFWTMEELKMGEFVTSQEEAPVPILANRTLLMNTEMGVTEFAPCREGAAADSCVVVEVRASPDPSDLQPLMEEMIGEMFAGLGMDMEIGFDSMAQTTVSRIVLDPATMIPYRVTMDQTSEVSMSMMGQSITTSQGNRTEMVYSWN